MPEPLLAHLNRLGAEIQAARQVLLFSDFDGTLVPIKNSPSDCILDPAVAETLAALAAHDHVQVGIVSGRRLADLRGRIGLSGIAYAGNHGLEMQWAETSFREPTAVSLMSALDGLVGELARALAEFPGAWVEHKQLSASVHFRQVAPATIPLVIDTVTRIVIPAPDAQGFVLRRGKAILEIRPAVDWHKGKAIRWIAEQMSTSDAQPLQIYLGDDDTDEDAFREWPGGITVCVGENRNTAANYIVRDPLDVHAFLNWLLRVITGLQAPGSDRAAIWPPSAETEQSR